jgi:hypothetical protein
MKLPKRNDCKYHNICDINDAMCPMECGMFEEIKGCEKCDKGINHTMGGDYECVYCIPQ